jgi:hypothetical protein
MRIPIPDFHVRAKCLYLATLLVALILGTTLLWGTEGWSTETTENPTASDKSPALWKLERRAETGDREAQFRLALIHFKGRGVCNVSGSARHGLDEL